jgi:hypothetical protein
VYIEQPSKGLFLYVIPSDFERGPDAGQAADKRAQNAPASQPVAVIGQRAQPGAQRTADGYANPDGYLHSAYCNT